MRHQTMSAAPAVPWFRGKTRRNLVDVHIEALDERMLSAFDPRLYVANLKTARVQAAMVYANSHVGYCYWPTRAGAMHPGLKGRNILREICDACHREGMDVVLYYSLVFDNWAWKHEPSWRILDADGQPSCRPKAFDPMVLMPNRRGLRYGVCCPNAEGYRRYTLAQIEDFCSQIEFEGVFFDMTFWPFPCFCETCARRFRAETGSEMPRVVDWEDPAWRTFQRKREDWIVEFGSLTTAAVKQYAPGTTVNHQFSTAQSPWILGVTERQREFCDYLGGDFYEDFAHQDFFCKLFHNISPSLPFEFHTSRCSNLRDHTTMKPATELRIMNFLTFAHQGATLFIDALDPVGTMNPEVYRRFGEVFAESIPFEAYAGGTLRQDVAVFYSSDSKWDPAENGTPVTGPFAFTMPHQEAAKRAATALSQAHVPCGVIGACCLDRLERHAVLVLPNILTMRRDEAERIRDWVRGGGCLYASGRAAAEHLGDVLGVHPEGYHDDRVSYMAPAERGEQLLPGVSRTYPLIVFQPQVRARFEGPAEVVATVTLPYASPDDPVRFASIHSDPPGRPLDFPAIVSCAYGKGRTIWAAAPIERYVQSLHREIFLSLIRSLAVKGFSSDVSAPPAVLSLVYDQTAEGRCVVYLLNVQELLPAVPVHDVRVRLRMDGKKAGPVRLLPDGPKLPARWGDGAVEFVVPFLEVFAMVSVAYG